MSAPTSSVALQPGDPAPWFIAPSTSNPTFHFHSVAGRYVVLCFFASSQSPMGREALRGLRAHRHLFNDSHLAFFGVSTDPADARERRLHQQIPGVRYFWDFDCRISRLFGAPDTEQGPATAGGLWLVLDPTLRVLMRAALEQGDAVFRYLASLPTVSAHAGVDVWAPVLVVPRIFEPELCRKLVAYYEERGGAESGFMREVDGKTVGVVDYGHKRRQDQEIDDEGLRAATRARIVRRLRPEAEKAFQFRVTRMERYIVACYDGDVGGYFRPHRDNTTKGTAHRRFAVTINLNAEAYEGGDLRFPEFGPRTYRAPTGGAIVFSCSLLHEATPVTAGRRYAFLPFLYDDAAAAVREANRSFLADAEEPMPAPPPKPAD